MPGTPYMVMAIRTRRFTITIPDTAAKLITLVAAAASASDRADLDRVIGCKILGVIEAGTDRGAFNIGDAADSLKQYVAEGADFNEPSENEYKNNWVEALADTEAVVVLYIG